MTVYDPDKIVCPVYRSPKGAHVKCAKMKDSCPHYFFIQGTDPQTGADASGHRCAFQWTPMLLMAIERQLVGLHAALNSQRNEGAKIAGATVGAIERAVDRIAPLVVQPAAVAQAIEFSEPGEQRMRFLGPLRRFLPAPKR